ncbi:Proteasome activator complex subunit 4 [Mortierella antarctica]|nr:Proteasome activator complex subunit 4 [Mortierella antarctica]
MQDILDDPDLQQLATLSLLQLAPFVYPAQLMPADGSTIGGINALRNCRCSQRDSTQTLIKHFKDLLRSIPLPARRKRDRAGPKDSSWSSLLPEGYSDALVKRRAGVLGLSSLLEAFPYDIPKWMPEVGVFLSAYFSSPPPVSTTVKKVFGDFKREHQDGWHEDQKRFTQEELVVLSDRLISPSYYA